MWMTTIMRIKLYAYQISYSSRPNFLKIRTLPTTLLLVRSSPAKRWRTIWFRHNASTFTMRKRCVCWRGAAGGKPCCRRCAMRTPVAAAGRQPAQLNAPQHSAIAVCNHRGFTEGRHIYGYEYWYFTKPRPPQFQRLHCYAGVSESVNSEVNKRTVTARICSNLTWWMNRRQ